MKNKHSKTNTHLSGTSLLSEEGPVPLPKDLLIPTVQKGARQAGIHSFPQPRRMREKKEARGGPPAWLDDTDSRQLLLTTVQASLIWLPEPCSVCKDLSAFAQRLRMVQRSRAIYWLRCEPEGWAAMNYWASCALHKLSQPGGQAGAEIQCGFPERGVPFSS